jgi:hypothetical protein
MIANPKTNQAYYIRTSLSLSSLINVRLDYQINWILRLKNKKIEEYSRALQCLLFVY